MHGLAQAPASAVGSAVYLGLLPSALGFVTWGYAVSRYTVAGATGALYLVPPVALAVAFVWLGETPRPVEPLRRAPARVRRTTLRSTAPAPSPPRVNAFSTPPISPSSLIGSAT